MKPPLLSARKPIVDLNRKPRELYAEWKNDDLRESQLLNNELFRPFREEREWYYGEAVEQPHHTEKGWSGYPGWVRKGDVGAVAVIAQPNAVIVAREAALFPDPECRRAPVTILPLGSRVAAKDDRNTNKPFASICLYSGRTGWVREDALRFDDSGKMCFPEGLNREVVENACLFQGVPYLWGGRSVPLTGGNSPAAVSGVDCSALVCLSYRLSGIDVPRNAHDQWIFAQSIEDDALRTGDLVFIAKEDAPKVIRHVMICTGPESVIEASETGRTVSEISLTEKFGLSYSELKRADFTVEGKQIYFGRITKGLDLRAIDVA